MQAIVTDEKMSRFLSFFFLGVKIINYSHLLIETDFNMVPAFRLFVFRLLHYLLKKKQQLQQCHCTKNEV